MKGRKPATCQLLALLSIGAFLLQGGVIACGRPSEYVQEETSLVQILTLSPQVVLTLTAWPTPPPVLTRPPTATLEPQPLWTAPPQPTAPSPTAVTVSPNQGVADGPTPAAVGSNSPAVRLLIPSLQLDVPVVETSWSIELAQDTWQSVWDTAEGAAGHHRNSANPGEAGNVVISGHHNTKGEVFRQVSEIGQPGVPFDVGSQVILVAEDGQSYTYTVVEWERFVEEGASAAERSAHALYMAPTDDATLTLVTCWPYEGSSHRVVVVARWLPAE